ncbi:uncharacterized protein LOC124115101 isoform X1 [Haliotis rufescens]|uniref:uncharacterized protein LOC124115101 isoform X1 n=1 Tax=Haliotis rufescens TaxID=6454 RepID=UPI00201E96C3|nr:uncharacterized protein LOC124115101 isoform X1 [Haliotis rufescens]
MLSPAHHGTEVHLDRHCEADTLSTVQAFLGEKDIVLPAFYNCQAEEKCLMLIKRPKDTFKKMLKAHSWANVYLSDDQLSPPRDIPVHFYSNTMTRLRKHTSRLKKKEDSESCTSATTEDVTHAHHLPQEQSYDNAHQKHKTSHVFIPISMTRNIGNNHKSPSHREINNNSSHRVVKDTVPVHDDAAALSSTYDSCTDIPILPLVPELDHDEGQITTDQLYTTFNTDSDELGNSTPDHVFRAHSLGNLTTGLTLSVVGQRNAGSMLNLTTKLNLTTQHTKTSLGLLKESRLRQLTEINGNIPEETTQKLIEHACESGHLSQQSHCLDQGRVSPSIVSSREITSLKGKRSLPHVPVSEASERIKRFTELMKARMALNSRASQGTISVSSMPVTPHQSDAQHNVVIPSDNEVSSFFYPGESAGHRTPRNAQDRAPHYLHTETTLSEANYRKPKCRAPCDAHQHKGVRPGHLLSLNCTPQVPDYSTDSGQTTLHSHSHCSTLDSGYVTNNGFDADIMNTKVSHSNNQRRTTEGSRLPQTTYTSNYSDNLHSSSYDRVGNNTVDYDFPDTSSQGSANRREVTLDTVIKNNVLKGMEHSHQTFLATINGFRPVREDGSFQEYHNDNYQPRHGETVLDAGHFSHHTSGKKITHYASQPNLNLIPSESSEESLVSKRPSLQRVLHRSIPVNVRYNKVENPLRSKNISARRHWSDSNRDPEQRFSGVHCSTESGSSSHKPSWGSGQQVDAYLQHQVASQHSADSQYCATLPGNWRFNGKGDIGCKIPAAKFPNLYQLAQMYNFHGTKVVLPRGLSLYESLQLTDHVVELPTLRETPKDPGISSVPTGHYPCLGGPGSAFQPVKSKGVTPFTLIAVGGIQENILDATSDLKTGDIIIEMNGRLILGADSKLVHKTLEIIQGEIILTVARSKSEVNDKSVKMDQMIKEIDFLRAQIAQRDTCIRDMHSLCPWQQEVSTITNRLKNDDIPNEEVEISDDEFIV